MKAVVFAVLFSAGPAFAEDRADDIPALGACLNAHMAKYEWLMAVNAKASLEDIPGGLWHAGDVAHCGTLGIVRCDRGDDPLGCQAALRAEQDDLSAKVRAVLPAPDPGAGETWPEQLYFAAYALAHGASAGADCAGAPKAMTAWCEAREASFRLRDAVLAYQVARYLGRVPSAIEAGWASAPDPVTPKRRPEGKTE